MSLSPSLQSGEGLRKTMLRSRKRVSRTEAVIVVGPPGYVCTLLYDLDPSYCP